MDSFWKILRKLMNSANELANNTEEMIELDFDSESSGSHFYATFHTNPDGNLVLTVFDAEQWSLVEDMSLFLDKSVEDIVRELDPNSPNVYIVSDDEIELGPPDDLDDNDDI